jgi:putative phosphotransacetylase
VPVFPVVSHVWLSVAHARTLFGDVSLQRVHTLASGDVVSDRAVVVEGPGGRLEHARVMLPYAARTTILLLARDARRLGLPVPLPGRLDGSPGCALAGPAGLVVLGEGVVAAERVVLPAAVDGEHVDLFIDGERPRVARHVVTVAGDVPRAYVGDDAHDLRVGVIARVQGSDPIVHPASR